MLRHRTSEVPKSSVSLHRAVHGIAIVTLLLIPARLFAAPAIQPARTLTFDQRIAAQRAIEQVYWNHRAWPVGESGTQARSVGGDA